MKKVLLVICFLLLINTTHASESNFTVDPDLTTNLVSFWELEEVTGVRNDSHGQNELTDINNVGSTIGVQGNAASFNANAAQKLEILDSEQNGLDITEDISVSLWFELDSSEYFPPLLSKYRATDNNRSYLIAYDTGKNQLEWTLSSDGTLANVVEYSTDSGLLRDTKYHLATTYDASEQEAHVYINGVQVPISSTVDNGMVDSIFNSAADFNIGSRDEGLYHNGWIDEVGIWSRVLDHDEVLVLYNSGNGISYSQDDSGSKSLLFTQIESKYPSLVETADWEDDAYADGVKRWCGNTIGECGCVITSLIMAGRDAGIESDILETDVNPKNINEYLKSVGGYTDYGAVRWLATSAYLGRFNSEGVIESRFASAPLRPVSAISTTDFIDNALSSDDNVVLAYQSGHFVWLPEKNESEYVVYDPWWYETVTANDEDAGTYVRDYNNNFTDARVLEIYGEPVAFSGSDIELHLTSETAELLFQNSVGDQVGYVEGQVIIDLDRATYGNTEVVALDGVTTQAETGKHLLVYEAGEVFTIEVVGTAEGEFLLEFFTINEFGETTSFELTGITLPEVTTSFSFDLDSVEVIEQIITLDEFLSIMDLVLNDLTNQQRAFFERWAKKMFAAIEEKTVSQAIQSIDTFGKLLTAKKVENPVMTSVLNQLKQAL